jgi:hypothetical protein
LKKVFLQELLPHKTTLDTVRETLLKVIEKVKAGISRFSMFKKNIMWDACRSSPSIF